MASLNKVILMGNLTRDPELRYANNGTPIAKFGLAVNTSRAGQGDERKEETCFVDITVFGRQAETVSEYLTKGRPALIEGRLQFETWDGKDGTRHSRHGVIAERVQFLGSATGGERQGRPQAPAGTSPRAGDAMEGTPPPDDHDDDLPF